MFYESDYIMRMIHLMRKLAEYLAGLTDAQLLRTGDDAIEEALRNLTGLSFDTLDSLSVDQLAKMVGGEGASRVYALAELLRMRAELHARLGFSNEAAEMDFKAFCLYLEVERPGKEIAEELYPVLFNYKKRFFSELSVSQYYALGKLFEDAGYFADAEDAFRAGGEGLSGAPDEGSAEFYRRILRFSDGQLERGGLPRREAIEGLREVEKKSYI